MKLLPLASICLAVTIPVSHAQEKAQGSWDHYQVRSLQSLIELNQSQIKYLDATPPKTGNKMFLSGESFASRVTLTYTGKTRALAGKRKELLVAWRKMLKDSVPENVVDVFATEMLFKEGDHEHWIPVQQPLLISLSKEVKVDQSFVAYVILIGAFKSEQKWEWLFAINEFDSP